MCVLIFLLLIDMLVIWFLLNAFSEHNWDDDKLRVFLITLAIVAGGGLATNYLADYLGFFSLGVYVIIGGALLKGLADLTWPSAFKAMGIFLSYKIVMWFVLLFLFTE